MKNEEFIEQEKVFQWAAVAKGKYPCLSLLQGSLNGIRLPIGAAVKAKRAGLKKGFPDISLPVPRNGAHGLFIELKKEKGGTVSPEQKIILAALNEAGNLAVVCRGAEEAITAIKLYLSRCQF